MKIFIFEDVDKVSSNYHTRGGLVVIAEDRNSVESLIQAENKKPKWGVGDPNNAIQLTESDWADVTELELAESPQPRVIVFPDAGCC